MGLRRKTPMKRGKVELKRTELAKVSTKQMSRLSKYRKVRGPYLQKHKWCVVCRHLSPGHVPNPSSEVHHIRGRNGALLWDTRFFAATCRGHREWPHDNPDAARAAGLLAEANDWGVVPKSATSF